MCLGVSVLSYSSQEFKNTSLCFQKHTLTLPWKNSETLKTTTFFSLRQVPQVDRKSIQEDGGKYYDVCVDDCWPYSISPRKQILSCLLRLILFSVSHSINTTINHLNFDLNLNFIFTFRRRFVLVFSYDGNVRESWITFLCTLFILPMCYSSHCLSSICFARIQGSLLRARVLLEILSEL